MIVFNRIFIRPALLFLCMGFLSKTSMAMFKECCEANFDDISEEEVAQLYASKRIMKKTELLAALPPEYEEHKETISKFFSKWLTSRSIENFLCYDLSDDVKEVVVKIIFETTEDIITSLLEEAILHDNAKIIETIFAAANKVDRAKKDPNYSLTKKLLMRRQIYSQDSHRHSRFLLSEAIDLGKDSSAQALITVMSEFPPDDDMKNLLLESKLCAMSMEKREIEEELIAAAKKINQRNPGYGLLGNHILIYEQGYCVTKNTNYYRRGRNPADFASEYCCYRNQLENAINRNDARFVKNFLAKLLPSIDEEKEDVLTTCLNHAISEEKFDIFKEIIDAAILIDCTRNILGEYEYRLYNDSEDRGRKGFEHLLAAMLQYPTAIEQLSGMLRPVKEDFDLCIKALEIAHLQKAEGTNTEIHAKITPLQTKQKQIYAFLEQFTYAMRNEIKLIEEMIEFGDE